MRLCIVFNFKTDISSIQSQTAKQHGKVQLWSSETKQALQIVSHERLINGHSVMLVAYPDLCK